MEDIYDLEFITTLFNEMSASYDRMNHITSFGFSHRFRVQFIERAELAGGHVVCDLMCGRGECWPTVLRRIGGAGRIIGIDLSQGMLDGARERRGRFADRDIDVIEGNALATGLADGSVDRVLIAFGLKTLSPALLAGLAAEIRRILRPGGVFSAVEMSEPRGWALRPLFMWYLKSVVPVLGKIMLGNPENYRMLGVYTERFQGCAPAVDVMRAAGLEAELMSYFYGCATGIVGRRPATG